MCLCERVLRISHMHSVQCNKCYLDSAHCQSACRLEGPRFGIWFPIIIFLIISDESRFRALILCSFPSYLHAVFGEDDPNQFFWRRPAAIQQLRSAWHARAWIFPWGWCGHVGGQPWNNVTNTQYIQIPSGGWSMGCWEFPTKSRCGEKIIELKGGFSS